jgi:cyclophilin family peptidyl-prolyl cis-trans isomerase
MLKYNYLPISNYYVGNKVNPKINAKFNVGGEEIITRIELFENRVPKTAGNYKKLLLGEGEYKQKRISLVGVKAVDVVKNSHVEFGDMEGGNLSIYGERFADESWEDLHEVPGLLSSISDGNTHNSRFIITLGQTPAFDYRNTIFGRLLDL